MANMSRKHNGAQTMKTKQCTAALFSHCFTTHLIYVVGNDVHECFPEANMYFGTIQTIYALLVAVSRGGEY